MADNVTVDNVDLTDYTVATDDDGTAQHQYVKLEYGADGTQTKVATGANALPIQDGGNSITVDGSVSVSALSGTVAVTQSGTWDEVGINDSGNSITVDNAALSVTGGGTEATAMRVTVATDSTGVLSVDDNGSTISVDDGAGSLTVDGTVAVSGLSGTVAVTQSGTWDEVGINDSGNSITVDNGGTFVVQENGAALTSLQLIDDSVVADDAAFTPATTKVLMAGFTFDDVAPDSVNEGDGGAARMSANRNVYTTLRDAAGNERGANVSAGNALLVDASATTQPVSIASVPSHAVTNAGTFVVQENGAAATSLALIDDVIIADDAAFTPATTKVAMAGFQADESSTDSVDEGDGGAARMTLDRKVIVTNQPHSAGGCSIFRSLDIDETEEDVKTSAGTVYGWAITNTATSTRFIKFYNLTAANTTVGSSTPVITFGIPGNASDDVGANVLGGVGINFDTAICVAATTAAADADTGAPGTGDVIINVFYK